MGRADILQQTPELDAQEQPGELDFRGKKSTSYPQGETMQPVIKLCILATLAVIHNEE